MPTYLSQVPQKSEYVSGVPLDLIMQVGMYKQQKYDRNQADIQNQLDQIASYELMKDEDRQYSKQRLGEVTDKLNEFSGYDLSDRRVANQLKGFTNNLYADDKLYTGITNTRRVRAEINKLNEIQEKHPEQFSKDNYDDFMMGVNDWLGDGQAGTKYKGQGYIPYYNYSESYQKIAKQVAENPDIVRMKVNGAAEREIKQVTEQKIRESLLNSGDQRAIQQMDLEWRVNHKRGDYNIKGALTEVKGMMQSYESNIQELQKSLDTGRHSSAETTQIKDMIAQLEEQKGAIKGKYDELNTTQDATRYYTRNKYMQDRISGIAKGFAYRQEGKLDYDELFLDNNKFGHDMALEKLKSNLRINEKLIEHKFDKEKAAKEQPDGVNPFEWEYGNIISKGEGQFGNERMNALFGDGKKIDADGNFNISNDRSSEMYLDLVPTLKTIGIDVDKKKADAYAQIQGAYKKWSENPKNQTKQEYLYGYQQSQTGYKQVPKSLQLFLASPEGKSIGEGLKKSTGFDINNSQDIANVNKFLASPQTQEILTIGAKLQKLGKGNFKVKAGDGNNTYVGNDGQVYGRMNTILTKDELKTMGLDASNLLNKGLIEVTSATNNKGETQEVYMVPMVKKATKDLGVANQDYITMKAGDDDLFKKNKYLFKERFANLSTQLAQFQAYSPNVTQQDLPAMKTFWTQYIKPQGMSNEAANRAGAEWLRSKEAIIAQAKLSLDKYLAKTNDGAGYQKGMELISDAFPKISGDVPVEDKMEAFNNMLEILRRTGQ